MKKVLVAVIMASGVAAVTFAALDSSNAPKKKKAQVEKKAEKKEKKKECKRTCFFS